MASQAARSKPLLTARCPRCAGVQVPHVALRCHVRCAAQTFQPAPVPCAARRAAHFPRRLSRAQAQHVDPAAADAPLHGARARGAPHVQGGRPRGGGALRGGRGGLRGARLPRLRHLHVGALRGLGRRRQRADAHALVADRRVLHHEPAPSQAGERPVHVRHAHLRRGERPPRAHLVGRRARRVLHRRSGRCPAGRRGRRRQGHEDALPDRGHGG